MMEYKLRIEPSEIEDLSENLLSTLYDTSAETYSYELNQIIYDFNEKISRFLEEKGILIDYNYN